MAAGGNRSFGGAIVLISASIDGRVGWRRFVRGAGLVLVVAVAVAMVAGRMAHARTAAERLAATFAASSLSELAVLSLDAASAIDDQAVPAGETKTPCQPGILPAAAVAVPLRGFSGLAACEQSRMPPTHEMPPPLGPPRLLVI